MSQSSARVPLHELLTGHVRKDIIEGRLRPGERITEERLSATYGVSRVPVREAIRRLEVEGFLRVAPNRGATVIDFDAGAAADLLEVHLALETLMVQQTIERVTPADIEALRSTVANARTAIKRRDWSLVSQLNTRFHVQIADVSRNVTAQEVMNQLRDKIALVYSRNFPHFPNRARQSWDEHNRLVAAIADKDARLATTLIRRHVENANRVEPL